MKPDATPEERFKGWYVRPVEKLKDLPEGDGAFAALMIVLPLYERLIKARLKVADKPTGDEDVASAVGDDLGLRGSDRRVFWSAFRVGFMHQAMGKAGRTPWLVSDSFGAVPEFRDINGARCVCLDPWKFADRVLGSFLDAPELITASESFPLAAVQAFPAQGVSPPLMRPE